MLLKIGSNQKFTRELQLVDMIDREKLIIPQLAHKTERWLRKEDTWLAKTLKEICPLEGAEYRQSKFKEDFDNYASFLIEFLSTPLSGVIVLVQKIEGRDDIYFYHKRIDNDGSESYVKKFKTMRNGADSDKETKKKSQHEKEERDPRVLGPIAQAMRNLELDELGFKGQLWQVRIPEEGIYEKASDGRTIRRGKLSLYGIRCADQDAFDEIEESLSLQRSVEWKNGYSDG